MSGHRIGSRPTHRRPSRSPVAQIMAPLRREPVSGQALIAFLTVAILCHLLPWATITGNVLTSTDIGFGSISGVFSALLIIAALVIAMWWMFMPTPMVRYLIIAIIVCALISLAIQYAAFADARSGRTLVGLDGAPSGIKTMDFGLPLSLIATAAVVVMSGLRLWHQLRAERPQPVDEPEEPPTPAAAS